EMADPEEGYSPVLIPAQLVFLFANFDEVSLTSGLPSTGLGAGTSMEEARLSGLLEVIERDAEKVVPYREEKRFLLHADNPKIRNFIGLQGKWPMRKKDIPRYSFRPNWSFCSPISTRFL
ncbi:MAG: YcaO-like family protein, partial [Deltaproteobacteria bacterium]